MMTIKDQIKVNIKIPVDMENYFLAWLGLLIPSSEIKSVALEPCYYGNSNILSTCTIITIETFT